MIMMTVYCHRICGSSFFCLHKSIHVISECQFSFQGKKTHTWPKDIWKCLNKECKIPLYPLLWDFMFYKQFAYIFLLKHFLSACCFLICETCPFIKLMGSPNYWASKKVQPNTIFSCACSYSNVFKSIKLLFSTCLNDLAIEHYQKRAPYNGQHRKI